MPSDYKNDDYLDAIRQKPCLVCKISGRHTGLVSEAHHENVFDTTRFEKRKNDYSTVPLCKLHHEQRHTVGFDVFWKMVGEYLDEREAPPFFIAASIVALYLADFLGNLVNDLDQDEYQNLLDEVEELFATTFNDKNKSEDDLRKSLERLARITHEQYVLRYRTEVN